MAQANQQSGAWIFLSHSNKDFEKVREIRNELEKRGHKPIMFYLKCLEGDNAMLPDLLRREIAAREWFILCDSPNAQASQYVRDEVELIKSMEGKTIEVVDLSKELQTELHKLIRISKRATVFVSCAAPDRQIAKRIRRVLLAHDYSVSTDPNELPPGSDWGRAVLDALDEASRQGFVLHLLSPAAFASAYIETIATHAFHESKRMNVLPVIVAPFEREEMPVELRYVLAGIQYFDLTTGPFEERVEELIRNLKTREME
jgi:hypothetical protein